MSRLEVATFAMRMVVSLNNSHPRGLLHIKLTSCK